MASAQSTLAGPSVAETASDNSLLILRLPETSAIEAARSRDRAQVDLIDLFGHHADSDVRAIEHVAPAPDQSQRHAIEKLKSDPTVAAVEPTRTVHAAYVDGRSDGPAYEAQAEGIDPLIGLQWSLPAIGAWTAWNDSVGAGVTVAVIDSGVDTAHPDLAGHIVRGWDYIDNKPTPEDTNGHGTHVTGIIAATKGNGIGIAGIAHGAEIDALRVLNSEGAGSSAAASAALDAAAVRGARIVNISYTSSSYSQVERDIIASHPDVLYIAAAGNDDRNVDNSPSYPCALPLENVICVGATAISDQRAGYSNYGNASVDIFAPGNAILSTWLGGGSYASSTGTSMSTPMVSAVAALLLAKYPAMTTTQLRSALLQSADRISGLTGLAATSGRLNAAAALTVGRRIITDGVTTFDGDLKVQPAPEPDPASGTESKPAPSPQPGVELPAPVVDTVDSPTISKPAINGVALTGRRSTAVLRFRLSVAGTGRVQLARRICPTKGKRGKRPSRCSWRTTQTIKFNAKKGLNSISLKGRTKVAGRWKARISTRNTVREIIFTVKRSS